ncbi:MAG: TIGR02147 family protein [Bdellovibrio sp.]|nr:TIGR02147 family protein [Bdellovibrio sp.]
MNSWIDGQNQKGLKGKLANAAGVSSTLISLILKGDKQLSLEQASDIADFIGLNDKENEYFFLLVDYGKAGTIPLREKLLKRIKEQQQLSKNTSRRIKKDRELTEEEKAVYYSSWIYTGVRNLSATGEFNDVQSISQRLNISPSMAAKALNFLLEHGLCKQENGKILYGPTYIHVDPDSPFVIKHLQNWHLRGFQYMDQYNESNLFYSCPMSLSKEAAAQIRMLLPKFIEEVLKIMRPAASEEVYCFNLDWFKY